MLNGADVKSERKRSLHCVLLLFTTNPTSHIGERLLPLHGPYGKFSLPATPESWRRGARVVRRAATEHACTVDRTDWSCDDCT
eukprot:2574983-Pleurochrysis_carterae.AAC.2